MTIDLGPGAPALVVPTAYRDGYAKAQSIDAALAARYVAHTTVGDPLADAAVSALSAYPFDQGAAWIAAAMQDGPAAIPNAPAALRALFAEVERVPDWFDPAGVRAGCRAFHRNSEMFVGAFVAAVLIEGFATLISQSFNLTGRMVDKGVRRLKQNNRHLVEIFLPGGLERHGEGWKLSVRIRLVHARIRRLLAAAPDWDHAAWGVPLSAAHIAFATAAFSGLLLERARMLGVELTDEERDSFMKIWRYSGHLMGVEPSLQCATQADALRLHAVGGLCEPPPQLESIILANGLINSAPIVAGITETAARRALARRIYRISRAMIGDDLADRLRYPPMRVTGTLAALRLKNRLEGVLSSVFPGFRAWRSAGRFQTMLSVSHHSDEGIVYHLPEHVLAERDEAL
ncbi:MAG: oxygenase MpaB family protein [Thalassobaculum sp.]|uniref:oxygenase MpaB family protein n=1 Tax=Thalassobaculum sp. TaxID=2022740 RepID=UPI0032EB3EB6